jgi:hypothetical protein
MNNKSKAEKDPVEEHIEWMNKEHETYIPPVLMKTYQEVDSHVSGKTDMFIQRARHNTQAVVAVIAGVTFGTAAFMVTLTSQSNPMIASLGVLGFVTLAILTPTIFKRITD